MGFTVINMDRGRSKSSLFLLSRLLFAVRAGDQSAGRWKQRREGADHGT